MRTVHSFPHLLSVGPDAFSLNNMAAVVHQDDFVLPRPIPSQSLAIPPSPARPASPSTQMSIQSLLAASRPSSNDNQQSWSTDAVSNADHSSTNGQPSSSKRKLDDSDDAVDKHAKIRRTVQNHAAQDHGRLFNMTTVICLHAAVAQKSYGSEKRFLCPPPLVRIQGPSASFMRSQLLTMCIVSENGDRAPEQKAPLDGSMTAGFKFLHVTGTAKAKNFQLSLEISEQPPPSNNTVSRPRPQPWATFDSAPVTIISKPSKKTAKTRSIASCILAGGPVSLFNRINSQTVRTKYMTIDHGHLCASNVSWSAFNVNVVSRPNESITSPPTVSYGCEIVLSDSLTGIATAPLIVRKVDKGKISMDEGGPVSQMQKIALQRVNPDGTRHYLSAAGPLQITSPPAGTPSAIAGAATPAPLGPGSQTGSHQLLFSAARAMEEVKDGVHTVTDEVDDYLCWTIVGISKFQYTFFDALGHNDRVPTMPITPFPTLFTPPVYRPSNNTLELTISNFFYMHPETGQPTPLEIWIGDLGPLSQRVYQPNPAGPLTSVTPYHQEATNGAPQPESGAGHGSPTPGSEGVDQNGTPTTPHGHPPPRYIPGGPLHTIVVVDFPGVGDVVKSLQDEVRRHRRAQRIMLGHGGPDVHSTGNPAESGGGGPAGGAQSESNGPESGSGNGADSSTGREDDEEVLPDSLVGRSLPLLFIRGYDGIGYHSGRTVTAENVFQGMDLQAAASGAAGGAPGAGTSGQAPTQEWLAAAHAAANSAEGGMHGWQLRVL